MLKKLRQSRDLVTGSCLLQVVDSGCSSHMTGNKAYLSDYEVTMETVCLYPVSALSFLADESQVVLRALERMMYGSVVSSPIVDEHLVAVGNTKDVNVGQSPISITIDPNLGTPNAKLFTGESSRKSVNFFTLITLATNGTHMAVLLESIRAISEQFDNMTYGFFLVKRVTYPIVANYVRNTWDSMLENGPWFRSSYDRAMIELQADVELKDTIVVVMPKLVREGFYTCNIRVKYEWKPPRCACCKVSSHV
ncbi:hypothetical protein Tco_0190603 [Tanacetum coccineum]